MTVKEVYDAADGIAPFSLSEEYCKKYSAFDNSGLLADLGGRVEKILFSLDLSLKAVCAAIEAGASCIVTHHPAIYAPIARMSKETCGPLLLCLEHGISVISAHLNLDIAPCGIDECLMKGLGGEAALATMEQVSGGGYGRVFDVAPQRAEEFVQRAEKKFLTRRTLFYGKQGTVKRAASFCGAGMSEEAISFALKNGANILVSSDAKHHLLASAVEKGLSVLLLTHYASELYGFRKFYCKMKERLCAQCLFFEDEDLL